MRLWTIGHKFLGLSTSANSKTHGPWPFWPSSWVHDTTRLHLSRTLAPIGVALCSDTYQTVAAEFIPRFLTKYLGPLRGYHGPGLWLFFGVSTNNLSRGFSLQKASKRPDNFRLAPPGPGFQAQRGIGRAQDHRTILGWSHLEFQLRSSWFLCKENEQNKTFKTFCWNLKSQKLGWPVYHCAEVPHKWSLQLKGVYREIVSCLNSGSILVHEAQAVGPHWQFACGGDFQDMRPLLLFKENILHLICENCHGQELRIRPPAAAGQSWGLENPTVAASVYRGKVLFQIQKPHKELRIIFPKFQQTSWDVSMLKKLLDTKPRNVLTELAPATGLLPSKMMPELKRKLLLSTQLTRSKVSRNITQKGKIAWRLCTKSRY